MQDANYWKQIFEEANAEAKRLEAKNMLGAAAIVALFFGLMVGAILYWLG